MRRIRLLSLIPLALVGVLAGRMFTQAREPADARYDSRAAFQSLKLLPGNRVEGAGELAFTADLEIWHGAAISPSPDLADAYIRVEVFEPGDTKKQLGPIAITETDPIPLPFGRDYLFRHQFPFSIALPPSTVPYPVRVSLLSTAQSRIREIDGDVIDQDHVYEFENMSATVF